MTANIVTLGPLASHLWKAATDDHIERIVAIYLCVTDSRRYWSVADKFKSSAGCLERSSES